MRKRLAILLGTALTLATPISLEGSVEYKSQAETSGLSCPEECVAAVPMRDGTLNEWMIARDSAEQKVIEECETLIEEVELYQVGERAIAYDVSQCSREEAGEWVEVFQRRKFYK